MTETRTVDSFDRVSFMGAGSVFLAVGQPRSVAITADDNLLPLIETRIDGRTLVIRPIESIRPEIDLVVRIRTPDLRGVSLTGAATAEVLGVDSESLEISISGRGSATVAGRAGHLSASIGGNGTVDAEKLAAKTARVEISGSGVVAVQVADELDIAVTGSGTVRYSGDPRITKDVTGSGVVEKIR